MMDDIVPPKRRSSKPRSVETPKSPDVLPTVVIKPQTEELSFKTPEETAAETPTDAETRLTPIDDASQPEATSRPATSTHSESLKDRVTRILAWRPHSRKQWILTSAAAIFLLLIGGASAWTLTHHTKQAPVIAKKSVVKKAPPPKPIYSNLSGLQITDPSLNSKPVTAVMIENSIDARPQSGLSQAGVVFEAQAEGGVTRFMALYQDTTPSNIGPIRSARPYYIQWALGFDAAYAHVGGSPDALSDISAWGVHDMNQFYNGSYYHRVTSRAAPHNVYTGVNTLNQLETAKGYTSTFTPWPRAATQKAIAQPTASSIDMAVSGPIYNPHYDFDATTNTYKRSEGGDPHLDAETNQQLAPTVVIAIVVPLARGALDSSGAYYSDYNVLGSGNAYIFQNGGLTQGQWHKTDNTGQLAFTDAAGTAIPLNRGQTWITAIAADNQVTYKGTSQTTPQSTK